MNLPTPPGRVVFEVEEVDWVELADTSILEPEDPIGIKNDRVDSVADPAEIVLVSAVEFGKSGFVELEVFVLEILVIEAVVLEVVSDLKRAEYGEVVSTELAAILHFEVADPAEFAFVVIASGFIGGTDVECRS